MTVPRIYLPEPLEAGAVCDLPGEDRRYVKSVLRLRKNDHIVLFDGSGFEYQARILEAGGNRLAVEILKKDFIRSETFRLTLCQALPKSGKMDFIAQKATELGVIRIVPFHSVRSVPRLSADRRAEKVSRWRKIAIEAARQSGRVDVPEIGPCVDFREMLQSAPPGSLKIIFWEEEPRLGIRKALRTDTPDAAENIVVAVGPEGGFSKEEVGLAVEAGFRSVSLGRRILRVETAVVAILSIIQYEMGSLRDPEDREA